MDIKTLFDQVTHKYDIMNDVMSLGVHRSWKKNLISLIPQRPHLSLLDLASGTGDIAFGYLKKTKDLEPKITLCDLSPTMLDWSKDRAINENIKGHLTWQLATAESLPFKSDSFDVCTLAFGLRNFKDRTKSLSEVYRVLKPKGVLICLEFSHPEPHITPLYDLYLSTLIPTMGRVLAQNEDAYLYLVESIRHFPGVEDVKNMIERSGFNSVSYIRLTKGITAIHRGFK